MHFPRRAEEFDQRSKSFQVTDDLRSVCFPNALQGLFWSLANHVFWAGAKRFLERGKCGSAAVCRSGFRASSPPPTMFQGPCTVPRTPCSSLMPPKLGPAFPLPPPIHSPSNIAIGPGAEPHSFSGCHHHSKFSCAVNALHQARIPARRIVNCLPPRGTRRCSLRKTPRHLGLVFGDIELTHIRKEWKDLFYDGVQTGHHGAEPCLSIYG